jgi:hypothetical protein
LDSHDLQLAGGGGRSRDVQKGSLIMAMVVRISRGSFPSEKLGRIQQLLAASHDRLREPVTALRGLVHYWAVLDAGSNTMANVSVWSSLADARQMDTLAPMLALAQEFQAEGVVFERPIVNSEVLWAL